MEVNGKAGNSGCPLRLAVVVSHPIQYQVPLFRELARRPEVQLVVFFCSQAGLKPTRSSAFGKVIKWDIPLLDGYDHCFLPNWSPWPSTTRRTGEINPRIWTALRRWNPDAVMFHGYNHVTNLLGIASCALAGIPILLRTEGNRLQPLSAIRKSLKKLVLPRFFRVISGFATIGKENAAFYSNYGVPKGRMYFAPYSVDNDRFRRASAMSTGEKQSRKERLGLDPDKPVVLFVAKLIPRKRPLDLLAAFDESSLHKTASLLFVGSGSEEEKLRGYVKARNLKSVALAGFVNQSELPKYYGIGDIFVLPSVKEPWGLVVNEAMACGLKVLASDRVGAAYDLLSEQECGGIFPVGDRRALADALKYHLDNPGCREARYRAVAGYSMSKTADGIIAAAKAVAGKQ